MNIAIIGSGIAGLAVARELSPRHKVTLFERNERVGLSAHGCVVAGHNIDLPLRMFGQSLWPNLTSLYGELSIEREIVPPSQSFSTLNQQRTDCYLKMRNATQPTTAIAQWFNSDNRRIVSDATRLSREGRVDLANERLGTQSIGEYLRSNGYSESFIYRFLYPTLASTVCTCSFGALNRYPARTILSALDALSTDAELWRVRGGTQAVVETIAASLDLQTGCPIESATLLDDRVIVRLGDSRSCSFDHVIVATQANTAARILHGVSDHELGLLRSVEYEGIRVVLHRDRSLMPTRRGQWATFNMITSPKNDAAMCSVWMNRFDQHWPAQDDYFQTIGPIKEIDGNLVISDVLLQRPVVTTSTDPNLQRLERLHREPNRRIWYVGSWAQTGIPLLESAVVSAKRCARQLEQSAAAKMNPIPAATHSGLTHN